MDLNKQTQTECTSPIFPQHFAFSHYNRLNACLLGVPLITPLFCHFLAFPSLDMFFFPSTGHLVAFPWFGTLDIPPLSFPFSFGSLTSLLGGKEFHSIFCYTCDCPLNAIYNRIPTFTPLKNAQEKRTTQAMSDG